MRSRLQRFLPWMPLVLVLAAGFSLRLINLGYADYQGDEINAFLRLAPGQTTLDFLLTQRKGPAQFLLTGLVGILDPLRQNQFLQRILFALFGCAALVLFYVLVKIWFGKKISLYATGLLATNGILVGLSRVVQYQMVVIFFSLLALLYFEWACSREGWRVRGIWLGFAAWTAALLAHYDAALFAPMAGYALLRWYRAGQKPGLAGWRPLVLPVALSGISLALFYIPFATHIDSRDTFYWSERLLASISDGISSSMLIFRIYQPRYTLELYYVLFFLGAILLGTALWKAARKEPFGWLPDEIPAGEFVKNGLAVLAWLALPLVIMEIIVYNPGTHIYTYLLPAFVLAGMGIYAVERFLLRWLLERTARWSFAVLAIGGFLFLVGQSTIVFVEHTREYPYERDWFLGILEPLSTDLVENYHLWMYGFPYYRNWEGIQDFIREHPDYRDYNTNESASIERYYMTTPGDPTSGKRYYIHITHPSSFIPVLNDRMESLIGRKEPVWKFEVDGRVRAEIYTMQ